MMNKVAPDLTLDDAYWESLLSDVEAQAVDVSGDEGHHAAQAARQGDLAALWQAAQRVSETEETIQVHATGCNRGGLLVEWNGLRGFMPASHLCGLLPHLDEDSRRDELSQRVGQTYDARVIEIDRELSRFVVSERLACAEQRARSTLMAELAPDQIRTGNVTNVCSFGAFVDLGGVEGLLHISEISWGRVNHPGDLLSLNQTVHVLILSVDPEQGRVALSMKRLQPDPWLTVEDRYHVGQIVAGVVTSVVAFGAFAKLEDGLEGLIHVSELAEGNFLHARNVVQEGQLVRVTVLNIDGAHRRLGLSLRQAADGRIVGNDQASSPEG